MEKGAYSVVLLLAGLFCIFCSVMNYDWFIESRKAWIFLKLFGRTGTRIAYIIIGIFFVVLAWLVYFNS